jgi:hypothetical protein
VRFVNKKSRAAFGNSREIFVVQLGLYGSDIEERAKIDIWMERFFELERSMWNASYNLVPETDVSKLLREKKRTFGDLFHGN